MSSQPLEATTASECEKATLGRQKVEATKATASKANDYVFIDWLFIGLTLVGGLVVLLASRR
jgi:hypothetical protein